MTDPDDQVLTEISRLRSEINDRFDRVRELELQRSHPAVIPVLHYWRHFRKYDEDYEHVSQEHDLQRGAFRRLAYMIDDEQGVPDGVSVGGDYLSMDKLEKMYEWPD